MVTPSGTLSQEHLPRIVRPAVVVDADSAANHRKERGTTLNNIDTETKRRWRSKLAGAAVVAVLASAGPALAIPAGFNNEIDTVRGVGSDTTYFALQNVDKLYNASPGCTLNSGDAFESCVSDGTVISENHDHDEVLSAFPSGSSNGVRGVCGTLSGTATLASNYARSSRDKQSSDCTGLTFKAFARDAIVPLIFPNGGAPSAGVTNLSKSQLLGIFTQPCTINNWNQLGGPNAPIIPWGVQTGSGTYLSFRNFLDGLDPNGCAGGISETNRTPFIIFENNAAPIAAAGATVQSRSIHWFSYGRFVSAPFTRAGGSSTQINSITATPATISGLGSTYPARRFLWNVFRTAGVTQATSTYLDWTCKTTAHAIDPETGKNYDALIGSAISSTGFIRLKGANCVTETT